MEQLIIALQDFLAAYGWYLAALLTGAVITLLVWLKVHPEDFYHIEEEKEEDNEKPV